DRVDGTDQRAAERGDEGVAARIARGVFEGETGALREAGEGDAFGGDAGGEGFAHERVDGRERGGEPRFVLRGRHEEALRIPAVAGRLRGEAGDAGGQVDDVGEAGDVVGRGAASV